LRVSNRLSCSLDLSKLSSELKYAFTQNGNIYPYWVVVCDGSVQYAVVQVFPEVPDADRNPGSHNDLQRSLGYAKETLGV
jgi:hypothetical protein